MKNIYKAIAMFQQDCPVVHKGTKGYGYSYADLPSIFEIINPILKKHGLGFTQLLDGENLKTVIFHIESGETIESSVHIQQGVQLAKMNTFQVLGSAITYYRRYSLSAALGIITDDDNDAQGEMIKEDSKKWLNPDTPQWIEAIKWLTTGGLMEKIEEKYKISKTNKEKLLTESI